MKKSSRSFVACLISSLFISSCYHPKYKEVINNEPPTPVVEEEKKPADVKTYTVVWIVEGSLASITTVGENKTPVFNGTPTKESTDKYQYTFAGWEPSVVPATEDIAYYAIFTSDIRKYDVTFKIDGEVKQSSQVEYGQKPVYNNGETPTKEPDGENTYLFTGWDPSIHRVRGNQEYNGTFINATNTFKVTFVVDGEEIVKYYPEGSIPSFGGTPEKESTDRLTYSFSGWDKEIVAVSEDTTYTAVFTSETRKYDITFIVNGEKTVKKYEYNVLPSYDRELGVVGDLYFAGWYPSIKNVTEDTTYYALFKPYSATRVLYCWKNESDDSNYKYMYTLTDKVGENINVYINPSPNGSTIGNNYGDWVANSGNKKCNIYYDENNVLKASIESTIYSRDSYLDKYGTVRTK